MQPYQMQVGYNNQYSNYSQFGGYNPMNYQERMNQGMQQYQQQQFQSPQSGIVLGKIVESIDVVKSIDIPMDGNMYYFPKADGSEIFVKHWLPNATTKIEVFKPVNESEQNTIVENNSNLSEEVIETFIAKIDELKDRFDKLEKSIKPVKSKKEVNADE